MDFNPDVVEVQDNVPVDVGIDLNGSGDGDCFGSHFWTMCLL